MHRKVSALLAELHSHTTWSDGDLSVRELVELYGSAGFDVLCVSDHAYRDDDPVITPGARGVGPDTHGEYLAEIESEAARAFRRYGLLVMPGLELSYNETDPRRSAHAVAVGLREHVSLANGLAAALQGADAAGAALIGAHPDDAVDATSRSHATVGFAADPDGLGTLVHRFELFNRSQLFPWVAAAGRERREWGLPPAGAPRRLEDAHPLCPASGRDPRVPPLATAGVPRALRPRSKSRGCLSSSRGSVLRVTAGARRS